ncbi:MAG TPA: hypothetical protein VK742_21065 [Candidatus Sulfotelmatobacter sp.]|jgi:spermidine synthase|nr:hypothetical protein [Candidatus Sulfotelmatobacter sp.]
MNQGIRRVLFLLFFLSGFSGLVYQVVWTRLAFASFGIIMPVLSVVLSVFMLGLSVGSWGGGRLIPVLVKRTGYSAIFFYAGAEFLIGLSAFAVPKLFIMGEGLLLGSGEANSFRYLCLSALVLAISILPWCVFMGTTFPFMMAYIREQERRNMESFSFLYLANVLGAMSGVLLSAVVLIEILGFRHALWVAAAGNFTVAIISICIGYRQSPTRIGSDIAENVEEVAAPPPPARVWLTRGILFSTGFVAMAMEVVWTRAFTPVLKTQVYSFAMIVFTYLGATFIGSWWYRRNLRRRLPCPVAKLMALLAAFVFLPILIDDPRFVSMNELCDIHPVGVLIVLAGICPFCAALGYLTPGLIDGYAGGHPAAAGRAYALNVLGCILGPLFASYVLLPQMSERYALILLGLPFFGFFLLVCKSLSVRWRWCSAFGAGVILAWALFFSVDFEGWLAGSTRSMEVRRDYAASVTCAGEGMNRRLMVNHIGMTRLTPVTKFMVHLPLAFHDGPSQSALIICFGMGTTYRSALSWNLDTTAVELVPDVPRAFGFYHADAAQCLNNPKGHIIVDDGRRFLMRTREKYDVIVIDPPPPTEAAGSSLLFSTGFYRLAKQHLNTNGILQMWFPGGEELTGQAVMRSLCESFPYVRGFPSVEGWGIHLLASMQPMAPMDAHQLAARMPAAAKKDLLEWDDSTNAAAYLARVITKEYSVPNNLNPDLSIKVTDDQPFNEYFFLRRTNVNDMRYTY